MFERMRGWSPGRRMVVLLGIAVVSTIIQFGVRTTVESAAIRLVVNLVLLAIVGWMVITFFRVLLRESSDEASKNPRPW